MLLNNTPVVSLLGYPTLGTVTLSATDVETIIYNTARQARIQTVDTDPISLKRIALAVKPLEGRCFYTAESSYNTNIANTVVGNPSFQSVASEYRVQIAQDYSAVLPTLLEKSALTCYGVTTQWAQLYPYLATTACNTGTTVRIRTADIDILPEAYYSNNNVVSIRAIAPYYSAISSYTSTGLRTKNGKPSVVITSSYDYDASTGTIAIEFDPYL